MCIENESTGNYACSHAPYTRFTSVGQLSNSSHPTGVIKPVYVRTTFPPTTTAA